jgi:hypothetical protein
MTVTLDMIYCTWNKQENQLDVCRTTDNAHIETYYGYQKSLEVPLHIEGSTSIFFIFHDNGILNVRSCFRPVYLQHNSDCNYSTRTISFTSIQCLLQNFFHRPDRQPFITGGQVGSIYI